MSISSPPSRIGRPDEPWYRRGEPVKEFGYERPASVEAALAAAGRTPGSRYLGGGTNLGDLMKLGAESPGLLVDVTGLPLDRIGPAAGGGVLIGATVRNRDLAADPSLRTPFPGLAHALLAGETPDGETTLAPGALITAVERPPLAAAANSGYRKARERASYAFAIGSVAAVLEVSGGVITTVRLGLGAVAPVPWRAHHAEAALLGGPATEEALAAAAAPPPPPAPPRRANRHQ